MKCQAENAAKWGNPASNFVAFIKGEMPILKAEIGVDGKFFRFQGVQPERPLFYEVSIQPNSSYVRELWRLEATKPLPALDGIVYGRNSISSWIVDTTNAFISDALFGSAASDPVANEVDAGYMLISLPLRLGFPVGMQPSLADDNHIILRLNDGGVVEAEVLADPEGHIHKVTWDVNSSDLKGNVVIAYQYSAGSQRPEWLPAVITVSVTETRLTDGKSLQYTDVHYIRSCTFGNRPGPEQYEPADFLKGRKPGKLISWIKGVGTLTENGITTPILPANTRSAAHSNPPPDVSLRPLILAVWALASISGLLVLLRFTLGKKPQKPGSIES